MADTDLGAQGTQAEAAIPNDAVPLQQVEVQSPPDVSDGIQKRIGELTAARHQEAAARQTSEALAAQLAQQNAELMRMMADMRTQSQAPAYTVPALPPVEVDPEQRRLVEAVLNPYLQEVRAQTAALNAQMAQAQMAQATAGLDPAVAKLTGQVWNTWVQRGLHTQGWTIDQAVTYSMGEHARQQMTSAGQARDAAGRFAAQANGMLTTQSAPPPVSARTALDNVNVDALPPDKQLEILEKRLAGKSF